jgi:Lar family restriction alleviation protein
MTNGERFKTAEERGRAYARFCNAHPLGCDGCELYEHAGDACGFAWLDLEDEEELKPCPFCGGRAEFYKTLVEGSTAGWVQCTNCGVNFLTKERDEAIAAWNRRVK